jgi:peptidoglycan/LPS O-acetylase OafA/YrhL
VARQSDWLLDDLSAEPSPLILNELSMVSPKANPHRADIVGLRAVAVLLVLFFHINPNVAGGGRVGVDVFFVISGFVITNLLLQERTIKGTTDLASFYAHRARRIIPMAAVVIIASLVAERFMIGGIDARLAADDARWTSVFLGNIRIADQFPTFLTTRPASPFQTFWSLAVEEQFYLVYPILLVALATVGKRWTLRSKLTVVLTLIIVASFIWSVVSISPTQLWPYYSPLTRAWELAVGGLVSVTAGKVHFSSRTLTSGMTWVGLAAIVTTGFVFSAAAHLPGFIAAIPVVGAALVIAGGTAPNSLGAGLVLRLPPLQYVGRWSYSLYLWQYPVLVVYAQRWGPTSVKDRYLLTILAIALSCLSYYTIETRIRRMNFVTQKRTTAASLALGALLILLCLVVAEAVS